MLSSNLFKFLILLICCKYISSKESFVKQYTTESFSKDIEDKHNFVMFFAPWCGHCQRLEPVWELLAESFHKGFETDYNLNIAKVDCTIEKDLCAQHDVTGYPTLKLYKQGSTEGVKFKGTRDPQSLLFFVSEQLGNLPQGEEKIESTNSDTVNGLTELNEDTFDKHISVGKHFVKFYAPWCGHCQKLAPTWEQLAQSFEHDQSVSVSKVDCTQHRSVCNQFDIKGYPTLLWIEDGKKIDKYQGQRTHEDLTSYINKMMGISQSNNGIDRDHDHDEPSSDSPSSVLILTGDDFEHGIAKGISFVKFFAPWCGHCKRLAPTWENLGKKFISNHKVNIIKVDCTLPSSKQLCSEQEVDGFPSLFMYKDGEKVTEYRGTRSLDDLYEFVAKHLGHDEL